ncbi:CRM-domain containing factor CFM3, chloroplastic/mitochondrial isoform X2 [Malania oleifera]|uniref:CRM-domain containing factor CFM3, chloroplastic/mitochondrial isoform X2 n=1 Tax=Malania oleifera TaxID=397392 RepID=UPI0025ADA43E|nr:CRM-domain containing factor CFM3, chloroplastic/mitochondrial isoform X2 [Malania oleifera]
MELSTLPLNLLASPPSTSSSSFVNFSSHSLRFLVLQRRTNCSNSFRTLKIKPCRCCHATQVEALQTEPAKVVHEFTRKKRKPRPSFSEQIRDKWSRKIVSPRDKFPWQMEKLQEKVEQEEVECNQSSGVLVFESEGHGNSSSAEPMSFTLANRPVRAPWDHGGKTQKPQFDSEIKIPQNGHEQGRGTGGFLVESDNNDREYDYNDKVKTEIKDDTTPIGLYTSKPRSDFSVVSDVSLADSSGIKRVLDYNDEVKKDIKIGTTPVGFLENKQTSDFGDANGVNLTDIFDRDIGLVDLQLKGTVLESRGEVRGKRSNTKLAESTIPDHELQRLRNVSLRMLERTKVGSAGITQALVDSIHEKWKVDEVVKLKFEGPSAVNMKRIHENLERRTGGLVIWRSGSSVVLYRGMSYELHCVKQYAKQSQAYMDISQPSRDLESDANWRTGVEDFVSAKESPVSAFVGYTKQPPEELVDIVEFNQLLDDLGPRFKDWSGRDPVPIDADLLPYMVPGYKPPFRLLPYRVRHCVGNKQMTRYRRLARRMPPHFALGRNKELQGLAVAMVKLWEKSAIAKIAIKRGVLNTCNERMAEEIKKLTGGTLLSRNKDYIVFYRGNDFLPPAITETLKERQKLTDLLQDEEELARKKASALSESNSKNTKGLLVAGTFAETMAAASRWGNQLSSEEIEKMRRDSSLARHASLVRYMEKKLDLAKRKIRKAEKALAKVQECLEPAELPTDLEMITDEERFLFRKIGLSMKPYLPLGRRGVYDGVVENMHLHWKFREVVKILVKRKNFAQVKHIAISLEAESGGVLVSLDKTIKGYVIIIYRGKNYQRPLALRPKNLLTKRQAFAQSVELQRREALKHHILDLQERIDLLKSDLEEMATVKEIDEKTFYSRMNDASSSDDDTVDDEDEEAYLEICESQ